MDIAAMNTQAQETAQQMKRQFPEMTHEQIVRVTRFIVLSAHAIQESEAFLAEKFGPDTGLSGKGYELIFNECAKETLLV
jgi:hypothetical protein